MEYKDLYKALLRKTHEGDIDWDVYTSGFQDEIQHQPPLYATVEDFYLRIDSNGRLEVTKNRVIYDLDMGSAGEDIYKAAHEASSLDLPTKDEITDELADALE